MSLHLPENMLHLFKSRKMVKMTAIAIIRLKYLLFCIALANWRKENMAKVTGQIIKERYAPLVRKNSFYQEQKLISATAKFIAIDDSESEISYYSNDKTGNLEAKNTLLLG